jgi:hypothetical protein
MSEAGVVAIKEPRTTTLYFGPWYRKSPYSEATLRHGCTAYGIYNHTELTARAPGGELPGRVAPLPFLDPKKAVPQG